MDREKREKETSRKGHREIADTIKEFAKVNGYRLDDFLIALDILKVEITKTYIDSLVKRGA